MDLNIIELCWPWFKKKKTCKNSLPKTRKKMVKQWKKEWKNFPQSKFQDFIACIPQHLWIVCFLKGDNKYREEKLDGKGNTKQEK